MEISACKQQVCSCVNGLNMYKMSQMKNMNCLQATRDLFVAAKRWYKEDYYELLSKCAFLHLRLNKVTAAGRLKEGYLVYLASVQNNTQEKKQRLLGRMNISRSKEKQKAESTLVLSSLPLAPAAAPDPDNVPLHVGPQSGKSHCPSAVGRGSEAFREAEEPL